MKYRFSRVLAGALAAVPDAGQLPDGDNTPEGSRDPEEEKNQNSAPSQEAEQTEAAKPVPASIEVQIFSGIEVQRDQNFNVSLEGTSAHSTTINLPGSKGEGRRQEKAPEAFARFAYLENGEYTLTVTGKGYVPYSQKITVTNLGCRVQIYTGSYVCF